MNLDKIIENSLESNADDYCYKNNTESSYYIFNKDCREGLKKIPDNNIDFIVTDPPYFIDGMDNNWNDGELKRRSKYSNVIGGIPAGMKFDRKQGENLQKFLEPICLDFFRILKPGGFCIIFSQGRLYHRTAMALDLAGFEIRDLMAWKYEGQAKAFSQDHFIKRDKNKTEEEKEKLIAELRGLKTPQLKPQMEPMVLAQKPREGTFVENWEKYQVGLMNTNESLDGKFPGTVMEVSKNIRKNETDEKIEHMTVKPVHLISHLIRLFTKEGQTVLDPFVGSGSHAIAAVMNNRNFIGYEIEKKYFDIAKNRLEKEVYQKSLF
ncbi:DNA methylase [Brachyspira hampsonii 30446]|uniref:Methyltransferase n=2 Tax=Brachyspira hampsonii TaxID=1287055 RepID=A0A2U4FF70_9SPIR|nr:site-specific DNA-methyltransferase [Brachyspira hampsonii]EKV58214.1 DNA methylase [Brachyspira hampsonii 30446]MBW5395130.1 site-specific DNA-methyltransferase [Brachyspira hampsonii]